MSGKVQWIHHKGEKILFNDYSGLQGSAFTKVVEETEKAILESGMKTVLVLNDLTGSYMDPVSIERVGKLMETVARKGIIQIIALLGMTTVKKQIADMLGEGMYRASSSEDGKDWLVSQARK